MLYGTNRMFCVNGKKWAEQVCWLFKREGETCSICYNHNSIISIHGVVWSLLFNWNGDTATSIHYHVPLIGIQTSEYISVSSTRLFVHTGSTVVHQPSSSKTKDYANFNIYLNAINCSNFRSLPSMFNVPMKKWRRRRDKSKVPFATNQQSVDISGELFGHFSP